MKCTNIETIGRSDGHPTVCKKEGEILRLTRKYNLLKEQSDIEAEKKVNKALESEYDRLSNLANSKSQMKIKELEKKLEDQIDLTQQMKRKQELLPLAQIHAEHLH